jgi:Ca2+-binding EF-hand superfamily protein
MFRTLLSLILATGVGVGAAYAQDTQKPKKHRPTAEEKFKQLNKAGDGKLTLSEFLVDREGKSKERGEKAFKIADVGNKGYLTLDEFKSVRTIEAFLKLNKAGDGKLTLSEFLARKKKGKEAAEKAFKAADKDSKGYLTLDEFKTIYPPRHHHRGHKHHDGDKTPEQTPAQTPEKPADKTPEAK